MKTFPFSLQAQGHWKWLSLAFLAIPALFYFLSWAPAQKPETFGTTILGPVVVGGRAVVVATEAKFPMNGTAPVVLNVRLCEGCLETLRSVALGFGDSVHVAADTLVPARGDANSLRATVEPRSNAPKSHLWIELLEFDGTVHRHAWRVTSQ